MMKKEMVLSQWVQTMLGYFKTYRIPCWSGIIAGFLAHMYVMTNKLVNQDDISQLFAKGVTLPSGRWGLDILSLVLPDYSMPWVYGIISMFFIIVASCIIINILEIKNSVFQALASALIITFPSLTGTFSYMFTSSSYAVSFFLACLAVYFVKQGSKRSFFAGTVLMVISLGIYQSYIAIASCILLLLLLQDTLKNDKQSFVQIIKTGICYVIFLGLSLALYYGITQLCFVVTDTTFGSYASQNLQIESTSIIQRVKISLAIFLSEIKDRKYALVPSIWSQLFTVGGICISLCMGGCLIRHKTIMTKIISLIIVALYPISINCMFLFTESSAVHTLVLYSFVMLYFLMIVIAESVTLSSLNMIGKNILSFCLTIVVVSNIYISNEAYLCMHLLYQNAYSFYTSLITEIKHDDSFDSECKIALVGDTDAYITRFDEFDNLSQLMAVTGLNVNTYSREMFIKYYIGFGVPFAGTEELSQIALTDDFSKMQVYPSKGSVQRIGDYLVVKFSDVK